MTWHIVRKDLAQLWILVLTAATTQFANAGLWFAIDQFREPAELVVAAQVFPFIVWVAIVLLIIASVHQDSVPGVSQDWLIRPIRRRDLLQAKVVFLLISVNAPMLLADFVHGIATGFGSRDSLNAATVHGLLSLFVLELPILALAAVTTGIMEVVGGMLAICLIVLGVVLAGTAVRAGAPPPFAMTGLQWMTPAFWTSLAVVAAMLVIPLQYFRRATSRSRRIVVAVTVIAPMLSFLNWASAFGLQRRLSALPEAAARVTVTFSPDREAGGGSVGTSLRNTLFLSMTAAGLPPESLVISDRAEIRLTGDEGRTLYSGRIVPSSGYHDDFMVNTAIGGSARTLQQIVLPPKVYALVRSRPVRAEFDYSFTLFRRQTLDAIRALEGDKRIDAFGWCKTRIDPDGDEVQFGCLKAGTSPPCFSLELENPENGRRNPESFSCTPDYAPYRLHLYPDALSQFGSAVRFGDTQGFARFPVDATQLSTARVIVKSYEPAAHFTRRVVTEIQPADWVTDRIGQ